MSKPKTLDELFTKVWKRHWDQPQYHESGHAKEVLINYENHVRLEFGARKFSKITRGDVRTWHEGLARHPVSANRCLELLSKLFNYASEHEWFDGVNPCSFVKSFTERKRKRFANEDEIKKIGAILEREKGSHPVKVAFIHALFFTGARPRSLERAKWSDFKEGVLTFDGKSTRATGEKESVLFPEQIISILNGLPKREDGLIFGIKMPSHLWRKIRKEAGCEDLWARDSRRTFATIGMSNGIKMDTVSELLNHSSVQTTKLYAKLNNSARSQAVDVIAGKMNQLLKVGG